MRSELKNLVSELEALERSLSDPAVLSDPPAYRSKTQR